MHGIVSEKQMNAFITLVGTLSYTKGTIDQPEGGIKLVSS